MRDSQILNPDAAHSIELMETDDFIDETLSRPLQIVYRDDHYVAVFKPAGLLVHRNETTMGHVPVLLQTLRDQLHRHVFPVHRLDRPTAGLILFGLSGLAAAKMVDLFTRRMVSKYYQALVCGWTCDTGQIDLPLGVKPDDELETDAASDRQVEAQDASTQFLTIARFSAIMKTPSAMPLKLSLLEVKPLTGRSHQIRRHLKHIGHSIIGDQRHGDQEFNRVMLAETGVPRMLLTSMRLDFRHPYTGELQAITVCRGSQFDKVVSELLP